MPPPIVQSTHHWHQVLGVNCNATMEEIKAAYKKQALVWHPDRHVEDKALASDKFIEINAAYKALTRQCLLARKGSQEIFARNTAICPKPASPFPRPTASRRSSRSTLNQSFSSEDLNSEITTAPSSICSSASSMSIETHKTLSGVGSSMAYSSLPYSDRNIEPPGRQLQSQRTCELEAAQATPTSTSHDNLPAYGPPLSSVGIGTSKEWKYSLKLTFEDLYHGRHLRFRITRYCLSGARKGIILDVVVPPGTQPGSRIYCRGVGHERKDGTFQDIVFIVEQAPHPKFSRVANDLVMDVHLPFNDELRRHGGKLSFTGIDGEQLSIRLDYPATRASRGTFNLPGHGMPVFPGGKVIGRGNLLVRWEAVRTTRGPWDSLKTFLHFRK